MEQFLKQARTGLFAAATAVVFATAGTASAQLTLLPNGDFENGGADWSYASGGGTGTFEATGGNPDGYAAMDAAGTWGVVFSSEDSDGGPMPLSTIGLTAGETYTFQFDAISAGGGGTAIKFESYTGDTEIGAANTGDLAFAATAQWGTYTQSYTIDPAADGIKMVFVSTADGTGYDNAGVLGIPEPASVALLGVGALALVRRRRA